MCYWVKVIGMESAAFLVWRLKKRLKKMGGSYLLSRVVGSMGVDPRIVKEKNEGEAESNIRLNSDSSRKNYKGF